MSVSTDTDLHIIYTQVNGSTCRNTISGSTSDTTIVGNSCGSATSVHFELPDHSDYDRSDFCIYSIGVACVSDPGTMAPDLSLKPRDMPTSRGQPSAGHPDLSVSHGRRMVHSPRISPKRLLSTSHPRATSVVVPRLSSMWATRSPSLTQWTTSTVYTTNEVTIISCAPTVTDCPSDSTKVVTSTIAISTTVCPISHTTTWKSESTRVRPWPVSATISSQRAVSTPTRSNSVPSMTRSSPGPGVITSASTTAQWTTSTIYTTSAMTVTSCAATVTDCPADSTRAFTSTIAISTIICPVSKSSAASSTSVSAGGLSSDTQPITSSSRSTSLRSSNTSSSGDSGSSNVSSQWTTSTIYTTREVTVTSCAAAVTNCPASSTRVVTSTIAISTTVCPVTETKPVPAESTQTHTQPDSTASGPSVSSSSTVSKSGTLSLVTSTQPSTDTLSQWTTSTIYTTSEVTVTRCAPTVTNCPADSTGVITSTVAISTTICPVTATQPETIQRTTSNPVTSTVTATASGSGGPLPAPSSPSSSAVVTSSLLPGADNTTVSATDTPTSLKSTTVYTTQEITVISCAPTVTDCPASSTRVITSIVVISTTLAPTTQTSTGASDTLPATSILSSVSSQSTGVIPAPSTTLTPYTTPGTVVASCATSMTDCRSDSTPVRTSTITISTTEYTASGSFPGGSKTASTSMTSSSSFSAGPTIPPVQPTTTSAASLSGSTADQLPPSDSLSTPPKSTMTLVAYTTTTICSATATVFVEASEDLRSSSTIPVFSATPVSMIYTDNSVGSTAISHLAEMTQTSSDCSAKTGQAGFTPMASMLTTVTTYPVTPIHVASESFVPLSSIGAASHLEGETIPSPTNLVFSQPTTGGSSLALQCSESSLLLAPECASNNDIACFCLSAEFARAVISCISIGGSIDSDVQIANADFKGMCTQWVSENFATLAPSAARSGSVPYTTTSYPTYTVATSQGAAIASAALVSSMSQSTWADASRGWAVNTTEMSSSSGQATSRLQATTSTPYQLAGSASLAPSGTSTNSASARGIIPPFLLGSLGILMYLTT